jgi:hypothetical protein
VVISIIALLVGILLPALGAARRTAQKAVCLGHQRSTGQGMAVYAADNRDWLAGPETSGFSVGNGGTVRNSGSAPTQNMDWISPTLGDSLGLPDNAGQRVEAIMNDDLRCPSNGEIYDAIFQPTAGMNTADLPYASYSAVLGFQFYNSSEAPAGGHLTSQARVTADSPIGYAPRVDQVGPPSNKVWATEGNRFWDSGNKQLSFNGLTRQIQGGNFMEYGPAVGWNDGPFVFDSAGEPTEDTIRLAFRHNRSQNNVFFDGHGASMDVLVAHPIGSFTLETFEPWFPSGALIANGAFKLR